MSVSVLAMTKRSVQVATPGANVLGRSGIVVAGRVPVCTVVGTIADSLLAIGSLTGVLTIDKTGSTARTVTFPDAAITVAGIDLAQTWTAAQTFRAASAIRSEAAATQDAIVIAGRAGGTGSYAVTLTPTTLTASRTLTLPDASIIVAGSASALTSGRVPVASTGGVLVDDAKLTFAGSQLSIGDGTTSASIRINGSAGSLRRFQWNTAGTTRWYLACDSAAESGANAGSGFQIISFDDAGNIIDYPLTCARAAGGQMTIVRPVSIGGVVTVPDGTAAAPGLRLTSEASGLYRVSSTSLGLTVAGVAGASLTSAGVFTLPTASGTTFVVSSTNADSATFAGGAKFAKCLGIGSSVYAYQGLTMQGVALSGATTHWGMNIAPTYGSDATSGIRGVSSNVSTAAASFTCGNAYAFHVVNPTIGAGSAITVFHGFYCEALSGAGTSYAFRSAGAGLVSIGDTTDASAIGTAALIAAGGASIAKNLWVGGTAGNYVNIANATGELRVNGTKVVTAQGAAVADASGGATVDAEARTAINTLLARLRAHGLIAT